MTFQRINERWAMIEERKDDLLWPSVLRLTGRLLLESVQIQIWTPWEPVRQPRVSQIAVVFSSSSVDFFYERSLTA